MRLGTASWAEGPTERRALVAQLPSDPSRVVDLNRLERLRLAKLGEGRAEALAAELVPPSLRQLLEGGIRAVNRARQVVAYAEKWQGRQGLPEALAPRAAAVDLLPCLPRPAAVRRWDGTFLDHLAVQGPGGVLAQPPVPTLAWVGLSGGAAAGCCLALDNAPGVVLGAWLDLDMDWAGALEMGLGTRRRRVPLDTWRDLEPREPRPAEVILAPPPHFRAVPAQPGGEVRIASPLETLALRLAETLVHPTVQ
ncbi:hypothetical protein [Mesoterricola silvestris]|uniref:Uncharacterized protein n=1 Tax=Mesoterricola silvestris TaxID=2927979 RepID=A0AA48KAN4_9BACT|nr:hypothetical protein [Mesoterricola silvestris]BDU74856.1 hypothetical protein METEAL_40300 [Mesoterricola silvestris]